MILRIHDISSLIVRELLDEQSLQIVDLALDEFAQGIAKKSRSEHSREAAIF